MDLPAVISVSVSANPYLYIDERRRECSCESIASPPVSFALYTGGNLCTAKGVPLTPGAVTQEVCTNTPDTCEVYIEKGDENGVSDIKTCREYCAAYGMTCTAQYDDDDGCGRGTK